MIPDANIAVVKALRDLSETLDHTTGSLNTITQFAEAYLTKSAVITSKLRGVELEDIQAFTGNLRKSGLDSADTAKVVIAWMEERAVVQVNRSAHITKMVETIFGSIRILLTDASLLSLLKAKLSPPTPSSSSEPKEGAN